MNTIIETNDEKLVFGEYVGACWNCAGKCVGKINGNYLFSLEGKCIGHFNNEKELYDCQTNNYIGELALIFEYKKDGVFVTSLEKEEKEENEDGKIVSYNEYERMLVNPCKTNMKDESFKCFGNDEGFIDESILIAINVPEGYKDFEI